MKQLARQEGKKHQQRESLGRQFEQKVYNLVKKHFPNALREVFVYSTSRSIVEIDMVVVHNSGLYLIEAKVKTGRIYGSPTSVYWETYFDKNRCARFYNPLRQTDSHVKHLVRRYRISPFICHSIIVFEDKSDIRRVKYNTNHTTVCNFRDLENILIQIKQNQEMRLSPFVLDNIYADMKNNAGEQKLRSMHKEVLTRILPNRSRGYT